MTISQPQPRDDPVLVASPQKHLGSLVDGIGGRKVRRVENDERLATFNLLSKLDLELGDAPCQRRQNFSEAGGIGLDDQGGAALNGLNEPATAPKSLDFLRTPADRSQVPVPNRYIELILRT
jgi:hypothetical protein